MIELSFLDILKRGTIFELHGGSTRQEILRAIGPCDHEDERTLVAGDVEVLLYKDTLEFLMLKPFWHDNDIVTQAKKFRISGIELVRNVDHFAQFLVGNCVPFDFGFTSIADEITKCFFVNQKSWCVFENLRGEGFDLTYVGLLANQPQIDWIKNVK